jgi:acyl-CoA dehydrogenase
MSDTDNLSGLMLEQADRLFEGEVTGARLKDADEGRWPAELWDAVEAQGLTLALVPEAEGGIGLSMADALALVGRSAWRNLPLPLAETMVAAGLWAEAGGDGLSGPLSFGPATPGDAIGISESGDGYALSGVASHVPWGLEAGHVLLQAASASGDAFLALMPKGTAEGTVRLNMAREPRATLALDGVTLPRERVRPAPPSAAAGLLAIGAMLRARQMVGTMERAMDYAVTYAGERRQFGRTLSKFQAIQHMLAEAAGHLAASEAASQLAGEAYGTAGFAFAAAVAKSRVGEAAGKVAEICHQVHGAMGFTQDHPLHFTTRRLWSWRDEFGHEAYWQARIGREVCAAGGEALWPSLAGG